MTTAVDKWPAAARLLAVATAGHLPTALTPLPGARPAHPERFRLVKPVDTTNVGVADVISDWAATKGTVGIRVFLNQETSPDPADPGINRTLAAATKNSVPVNLAASGRLDQVAGLASRNPDTVLVVDHLGLQQPFHPPAPAEPWANLPKVLALASHPNIRIKISGACTLSHEPYPYNDIWDPVLKVIDAFGIDRCMWGTDWTRATELLTYESGPQEHTCRKLRCWRGLPVAPILQFPSITKDHRARYRLEFPSRSSHCVPAIVLRPRRSCADALFLG